MHSIASCGRKIHVVLQCYFFFPLRTPRTLSTNILSFYMVTYNNLLVLLSFSESVGTMMLSVLYVIFVKKLYIWFKFLGIHVFKWGTNKVTGWLRNRDSFVVHHYSKSFVVAPCKWNHWTMILLQRMKRDKIKKAIKQIFRCLEGHYYYWLAMFYILNSPKVWQFKLYMHQHKTLTAYQNPYFTAAVIFFLKFQISKKNLKIVF